METLRPYLVEFEGEMNDAVGAALSEAGITVFGVTGGGTVAEGAPLPERNHHYVRVYADGPGEAAGKLADAIGDLTPYTPRGVSPLPA